MHAAHRQNMESWDAIADDWFGSTALPTLGVCMPPETELELFDRLEGARVLELGCGSGHSLAYCAARGAAALWGLDLSGRQLENARRHLESCGLTARLFQSPMERNPGLPEGYFDYVYSVYAIGWSLDLAETFRLAASYLKRGGAFIFSWDHPFMRCVAAEGERYVLDGGFFDNAPFSFEKNGKPVTLINYNTSDYINALAGAGFAVERMVEATDAETLSREEAFSSRYYAAAKARLMPLSFAMKARKL